MAGACTDRAGRSMSKAPATFLAYMLCLALGMCLCCCRSLDTTGRAERAESLSSEANWLVVAVLEKDWSLRGRVVDRDQLLLAMDRTVHGGVESVMVKTLGEVSVARLELTLQILREAGFQKVRLWDQVDGVLLSPVAGGDNEPAEVPSQSGVH